MKAPSEEIYGKSTRAT